MYLLDPSMVGGDMNVITLGYCKMYCYKSVENNKTVLYLSSMVSGVMKTVFVDKNTMIL